MIFMKEQIFFGFYKFSMIFQQKKTELGLHHPRKFIPSFESSKCPVKPIRKPVKERLINMLRNSINRRPEKVSRKPEDVSEDDALGQRFH